MLAYLVTFARAVEYKRFVELYGIVFIIPLFISNVFINFY